VPGAPKYEDALHESFAAMLREAGAYFMKEGPLLETLRRLAARLTAESIDLREQLPRYRAAGIEEIWLIDPFAQRLRADTRREGTYRSAVLADGRLDSLVLPGLWIDVDWLWRSTLPSSVQSLRAIIG
jgi:Putative restriction endonuclease